MIQKNKNLEKEMKSNIIFFFSLMKKKNMYMYFIKKKINNRTN